MLLRKEKTNRVEFSSFSLAAGNFMEEGIMVDILFRLPVKSLIRFTSVCKSWHSLISNPNFARAHLNRVMLENLNSYQRLLLVGVEHLDYVMKSLNYERSNFEAFKGTNDLLECQVRFNPMPVTHFIVLGSCDGLVCLDSCDGALRRRTIIIWNPTTGEFKLISPPDYNCFRILGFGFDPVSDDYKILACAGSEVTIFAMKDKSWRSLRSLQKYMPDGCTTCDCGVYLNGCLHWMWNKEWRITLSILSFDLSKEKFQMVIPLPEPDIGTALYDNLTVLRGRLFLYTSYCNDRSSKCWILDDYDKGASWTQFCDLTWHQPRECRAKALCLSTDGKILLHLLDEYKSITKKKHSLCSYSPEDNSYQLATLGELMVLCAVMYVESLISP